MRSRACGGCPADWRCVWVDGQQQCVAPSMEGAGQLEEMAGARKSDDERNQALCLLAGISDCSKRPHRPLPPEEDDEDVDIVLGASP